MWLVFENSWNKLTLNVNYQVRTQQLYTDKQHSHYSDYQKYLYKLCTDLRDNQKLTYKQISQRLNEMNLKSCRNKTLKNTHVFSILKKGKIREERNKNRKSHLDYSFEDKLKNCYISYDKV